MEDIEAALLKAKAAVEKVDSLEDIKMLYKKLDDIQKQITWARTQQKNVQGVQELQLSDRDK